MAGMTKLLRKAIRRVRELPAQEQDALAHVLLSMAEEKAQVVDLDDDTLSAIEEGIAHAELGAIVSCDIVAEVHEPQRESAQHPALPVPASDGDDSAGDGERVLDLLPVVDPGGRIEPKPEVIASTPALIFSAGHGTAAAATLEQAANAAVADE